MNLPYRRSWFAWTQSSMLPWPEQKWMLLLCWLMPFTSFWTSPDVCLSDLTCNPRSPWQAEWVDRSDDPDQPPLTWGNEVGGGGGDGNQSGAASLASSVATVNPGVMGPTICGLEVMSFEIQGTGVDPKLAQFITRSVQPSLSCTYNSPWWIWCSWWGSQIGPSSDIWGNHSSLSLVFISQVVPSCSYHRCPVSIEQLSLLLHAPEVCSLICQSFCCISLWQLSWHISISSRAWSFGIMGSSSGSWLQEVIIAHVPFETVVFLPASQPFNIAGSQCSLWHLVRWSSDWRTQRLSAKEQLGYSQSAVNL